MSLQQYIDDAVTELDDLLEESIPEDEMDLTDRIIEIADSNTPIYYSDMLDCVSDDITLFITRSDLAGPEDTPDKLIQLNIFDKIEEALNDRLREWIEDYEYPEEDD